MKQQEQIEEPKEEKLREKAFLARIAGSIAIIVLCLVGMSFTAYAYFTCSVTSGSNTIKAANFALDVTVNNVAKLSGVTQGTIPLEAGTYNIQITKGNTTGTGFCLIKVGSTYIYTHQLGVDVNTEEGEQDHVSFTLVLNGTGEANVEFVSIWGTSSYYATSTMDLDTYTYYVGENGVTIEVTIESEDVSDTGSGNTEATTPTDPAKTESTEPSETEPTETQPEMLPEDRSYVIQKGDTLRKIAEKFGTTVEEIAAYNNLSDPDNIFAGQTIKIPPEDYEIPVETEPADPNTDGSETSETDGSEETGETVPEDDNGDTGENETEDNDTVDPTESTTPATDETDPIESTAE